MNKVILIWNITKDKEIKALSNGGKVCNTAIATNENYTDKEWVKQQLTEFHNLTCFDKTADLFESYVHKWDKIMVEGKIKTKSWETDWVKRYSTYIQVERIEFLGWSKKEKESEANEFEESDKKVFTMPKKKQEEEISIEDIPF
jgi:single-strand DNA-binding protein